MRLSEIQGNPEVTGALQGMISSGRVPHAIMLHENDGGGAMLLVQAFLQALFCRNRAEGGDACCECPSCNKVGKMIHPDIRYVFPVASGAKVSASEHPTGQSYLKEWRELVGANLFFTEEQLCEALEIESKSSLISVWESRGVLDMLSLHPLEGGWRAIVVYLPEKMNAEAANRLLKAVEEPPEKTVFVMVTHAPERVLQTISSRCLRIRVMPFAGASAGRAASPSSSDAEYGAILDELMQSIIAHDLTAALDSISAAVALPSREKQKSFCKFAAGRMRQLFLLQQGLAAMVPDADDTLRQWASSCRRTFARGAEDALSRAVTLIERNVNQKILFTDLVDRLFLL